MMAAGRRVQTIQRFGHDGDGGVKTKRNVRGHQVVVDRLWNAYQRQAAYMKLVGNGLCAIPPDAQQTVKADLLCVGENLICQINVGCRRGLVKVAWVGTVGCAQYGAALLHDTAEVGEIQFSNTFFNQAGKTIPNANDLMFSGSKQAFAGRPDDRIQTGAIASSCQHSNSAWCHMASHVPAPRYIFRDTNTWQIFHGVFGEVPRGLYIATMKRIVTPDDMRAIDRVTINERGIPGETLMERAGRAVIDWMLKENPEALHQKITIICGKGNNGGDGLVVARLLTATGTIPEVFLFGQESGLTGDALANYRKLVLCGVRPSPIESASDIPLDRPDVVVDALLGTGTKGALEGDMLDVVKTINSWKLEGTYVVAIDIPSGLNGESGEADEAVIADLTVTIGLPKRGLLLGEGKHFCGKLRVADIGFPRDLTDGGDLHWIEAKDVCDLFPRRYHQGHKYDFGRLLIVAGSRGMTGAAVLCARAAIRSGVGMVRVAMPASCVHVIEHAVPEVLTVAMPETATGSLSKQAHEYLKESLAWCEVLAIGPGLSRHPDTVHTVQAILKDFKSPSVVDADALFALSQDSELLERRGRATIVTPHVGEFCSLSGFSKEDVLSDRVSVSRAFARRARLTVLLKGSPTIITESSGRSYVTRTGNPGMATAGSGDVLTGIVAAMAAQRLTIEQAGYCGALLHGLAGDLARAHYTEPGVTASTIVDFIPGAFRETGVW